MKKRYKKRKSAQQKYFMIAVVVCLLSMLFWYTLLGDVGFILLHLLSINMSTLLMYAWDKAIAGKSLTRVPEIILHSLALLGGSPMALIGQKVFHHKTRKSTFQAWQYGVITIQILLIVLYIYTIK